MGIEGCALITNIYNYQWQRRTLNPEGGGREGGGRGLGGWGSLGVPQTCRMHQTRYTERSANVKVTVGKLRAPRERNFD